MFENIQAVEEMNATKLIKETMSPIAKSIIATSIFFALKAVREFCQENPSLPKITYYDSACQLRFIIYRTVAKMIDEMPMARMTYFELTGSSSPLFIFDSVLQIQFKKTNKMDVLPSAVQSRTARALDNKQLTLPFGVQYNPAVYCLVTYDHKALELKYMQIGIPDQNYGKWLAKDNLVDYIDKAMMEKIEKEYKNEFKQEIADTIGKKYKLSLKG